MKRDFTGGKGREVRSLVRLVLKGGRSGSAVGGVSSRGAKRKHKSC